ncbi:flavin reductase like domain-containing protein [Xylaria venustula]|nr:flavin reductase like domain-containing protein [Xylaria venustula]
MQSIRGLRRAIQSTRPRYASLYRPSRSIASSLIRRNVDQTLQASNVERPAAIRAQRGYTSETNVKPTAPAAEDVVAGSGATKARPDNATKGKDDTQNIRDLCSSVTATMAKLPHPAVVITTLDRTYSAQAAAGVPTEKMQHPIARGVTVSSFTSLCIRPRPHVMFNMTLPSTMYEALIACKDFNVHVLTPDESGARIANVFTRGNRISSRIGSTEAAEYALDVDADLGVFAGLKDEGLHHVEITNRNVWHEQFQDAKERGLDASRPSKDAEPVAQDPEIAEPMSQVHHVPCLHSTAITEVLNCRLVRTIYPELPNAGQNVVMIGEVVGVTFPKQFNEKSDRTPVALSYADRRYRSVGDAINMK